MCRMLLVMHTFHNELNAGFVTFVTLDCAPAGHLSRGGSSAGDADAENDGDLYALGGYPQHATPGRAMLSCVPTFRKGPVHNVYKRLHPASGTPHKRLTDAFKVCLSSFKGAANTIEGPLSRHGARFGNTASSP